MSSAITAASVQPRTDERSPGVDRHGVGVEGPAAPRDSLTRPGQNEKQGSATSRDNHAFDPASSCWTLNKDVSIVPGLVLDRLADPLRAPYRRLLQFFAEHYSAAYTAGIHEGIEKLLRDTGADAFSVPVLRSYRAGLDREHEWRLATIRAFLIRWHEQGYPGVSREVVDFLSSLTLRGNPKGGAVLSLDPDKGPFDDQELEAILDAAPQCYEQGGIDLDTLAITLLLVHTGRRPGQLTQLRIGDLQRTRTSDGRRIDIVQIPRSKQRGRRPRAQFKAFWLAPDLCRVLTAQRNAVIERVQTHLGELPASVIAELPLFPNWHNLQRIDLPQVLEEALRNDALHRTIAALRAGLAKLHVLSARTGRRLHITPRRFRYTLGTRAAREGYGAMVIAELLDHSDGQNAWVYTRDHPNFRQRIDRAVGQQLAPLARAFAGDLVDTEAQARHGHDPSKRVGTRQTKVGTCGSAGFCGAQAYACYTCLNFQPWLDAPHEKVLQWFLGERQRAVDAGASANVVASTDSSIVAVQGVIAACEARSAEIGGAGS